MSLWGDFLRRLMVTASLQAPEAPVPAEPASVDPAPERPALRAEPGAPAPLAASSPADTRAAA